MPLSFPTPGRALNPIGSTREPGGWRCHDAQGVAEDRPRPKIEVGYAKLAPNPLHQFERMSVISRTRKPFAKPRLPWDPLRERIRSDRGSVMQAGWATSARTAPSSGSVKLSPTLYAAYRQSPR